jgi:hypothetical protein
MLAQGGVVGLRLAVSSRTGLASLRAPRGSSAGLCPRRDGPAVQAHAAHVASGRDSRRQCRARSCAAGAVAGSAPRFGECQSLGGQPGVSSEPRGSVLPGRQASGKHPQMGQIAVAPRVAVPDPSLSASPRPAPITNVAGHFGSFALFSQAIEVDRKLRTLSS